MFSAYQPIYGLVDGCLHLAAFEGLVRPFLQGAAISPASLFSDVALADRLFIETLCRTLHIANFGMASPGGRLLFININPAIYETVGVVEREFETVFAMLQAHGVPISALVCEMLETEALSGDAMQRLWDMVRDHGAQLAIDDFGAGLSGITRYRQMRPDIVKLDGHLFRDMAADPKRVKMLRSLARTFRQDGATILIEGIETAQQLEIAHHVGATMFQGYYLGRPQMLPASFPAELEMTQALFDAPMRNSL